MLQNCCRFVAKRRISVLFLFCQFSVDPAKGVESPYPVKPRFWNFALRSTCSHFRRDGPAAVGLPCCVWAGIPKFSLCPHLFLHLRFFRGESFQNSLSQTNFWWHVDRQRSWLTGVYLQEHLHRSQSLPVLACLLPAGTDPHHYSQVFCCLRGCDSESLWYRQYK